MILTLAIVFALSFASSSLAIMVNEKDIDLEETLSEPSAGAVTVQILTEGGSPTTKVRISDPWTPNIYPYWLRWAPAKTVYKATSLIVFIHDGNPQKVQVQTWDFPGGYAGYTLTPFGYADWGGSSPTGKGLAIVIADGDNGYVLFDLNK